ncbi:N-acetylmuramoyl-L-alanine amidase family protein [Asaccharospora irregularis]|uniref:N-acetylmuramoyl-L-alanine amidase n=2 Tax=Asaccharospora TaxID=1505660 RepID=A0A1M5PVZ7_9FIRM|nr:N-acetylmuramoyl-L-alanine amidase [Asaccharospora irregularis DSM 2635]
MSSMSKKSVRKRKLNKKKLLIVICFLMIAIFSVFKIIQYGLGALSSAKLKSKNSHGIVIDNEQFELGDESENANKKFTVLVDAGHGGYDKGTSGKLTNVYEKDLSLQIAKKVANKLAKQDDVQVVVTRKEDRYVSLSDRPKVVKDQEVDLLVSIHLNAEKNGNTATGIETYYKNGAEDGSKELARIVQDTMISYVPTNDRGILGNNFEILREAQMPAILVECGFLTTPEEEQKLLNQKYQDQLTEGIVQGILSFLDQKSKG